MLLYHNGVSNILILLIKVSFDISIFKLSSTLAQKGLKFISEILSKKSLPNVKTPESSKLSGIAFHFAVVHSYLLNQPILRELSNSERLCNLRPPSLISASIICFLNLGGFPPQRKSFIIFCRYDIVDGLGLGRDRSIWVILEKSRLFIRTTLPYGVKFLIFHTDMMFFISLISFISTVCGQFNFSIKYLDTFNIRFFSNDM